MNGAHSQKLNILQGWDHSQNSRLFRVFQLRLKADKIIGCFCTVFRSKLNNGESAFSCFWVSEANWFHGAETKTIFAGGGDGFDRLATLKKLFLFKRFRWDFFTFHQSID